MQRASTMTTSEEESLSDECKELLLSLPKVRGRIRPHHYLFQGFWSVPQRIQAIITFQNHFQARDSDIVVATLPKSGTTWLKGLTFAAVNRRRLAITEQTHPLRHTNSHVLVPFLETHLYGNNNGIVPNLSKLPEPRLLGTHIPFPSLGTLKESNCKIVYMCRNPFDTYVSGWNFFNTWKLQSPDRLSLSEDFDMFCKGEDTFGPFWDHMLGYWRESMKRPNNVLFLTYEDMKKDGVFHLKKMAKFLDCPFSEEEERCGMVEDILKLCSFETMKELEVNQTGVFVQSFDNKSLFRKGEVGDFINYLNPEMVERLSRVIEDRLGGSGLSFQVYN